jgi:SAM-dependent methyltransferase
VLGAAVRQWIENRTDTYYERTLTDRALAEAWRSHYLGGLLLPPRAEAFEHGCGRGRHLALLTQSGFRAAGVDVIAHPWWDRLPHACFQVVPTAAARLPWGECEFDLALSFLAISELSAEAAAALIREMRRILRPGGYLLIFEVNTASFGAAAARRWYGRLHSATAVRTMASRTGFQEVDFTVEGFASPILPVAVNALRKSFLPAGVRMTDYDSWLARLLPEYRRDRWLLRLRNRL